MPAASIRYLRGAELAVMQVNSNQQICAQFDFQNNLPLQVRPDGGRVSAKGSKWLFLVHGFISAFTVIQQAYRIKSTDWLEEWMKQSRYWVWDLLLFPVCFTLVCNHVQAAYLPWFLSHSSHPSGFKNCCSVPGTCHRSECCLKQIVVGVFAFCLTAVTL